MNTKIFNDLKEIADIKRKDSKAITKELTEYLCNLLKEYGYEVHSEFSIGAKRTSKKVKRYCNGYVDIYAKKNNIEYCIEIDRGNKEWSLQKLDTASKKGMKSIWIRWKGIVIEEQINKYDNSILVYSLPENKILNRTK